MKFCAYLSQFFHSISDAFLNNQQQILDQITKAIKNQE